MKNVISSDDSRLDGGVLGLNHCEISESNDTISLRATMYAVYAAILFDVYEKYIAEDNVNAIPADTIRNPMFPGLRFIGWESNNRLK